MRGTNADARNTECIKHIALYVRKKSSTPEGWMVEMKTMISKSTVGRQYWVSFLKKMRAKREGEFNAGKEASEDITYEDIRHFMELVLEDDSESEGMMSTGRMHSLQTSGGDHEEEDWFRAIDHMQRQQQRQQDEYENQHQQQTNLYHAQVQKDQDKQYKDTTKMSVYMPSPNAILINGKPIWQMCSCCGMHHPDPTNDICCQRNLQGDGTPVVKWNQWNGWNLEYLATLQAYQVEATLKKMATIGEAKAIPAAKIEEAREQIRLIRINSPPGKYRRGGSRRK
jgi:hypothetical protein